jgi:hypothetical protein
MQLTVVLVVVLPLFQEQEQQEQRLLIKVLMVVLQLKQHLITAVVVVAVLVAAAVMELALLEALAAQDSHLQLLEVQSLAEAVVVLEPPRVAVLEAQAVQAAAAVAVFQM